MIIFLFASIAFSETTEDSLSYLEVLSTLESLSVSPHASLHSIGKSSDDRDIWALWINQNKDYNALAIGFANDESSIPTLQVLNLIEIALDKSSKISANILFVPMLSVNSCNLGEEEDSHPQIFQNSKLSCLKNANEDDMNTSCEVFCRSFFDNCDENTVSPKESDIMAIKNLIETNHFDLILGYFAGSGRYIVPKKDYFAGLSIPYNLEENNKCESLVEYGHSQGIITVATFIPDRSDLSKNSEAFFSILSHLYPKLTYGTFYSKLEGHLKITLENTGMKPTKSTELRVEFSDIIFNARLEMKYANTVMKYPLSNARSIISVGLPEIQPFEDVYIYIDFKYSEPVGFELTVDDYELNSRRSEFMLSMQMIIDPRYLVIGAIILIALIIPIRMVIKRMREPKTIRIPNRFLSGQLPQYLK